MTYRNDQDAALLRIEALERENARLERENEALRNPRPATPSQRDEDEPLHPQGSNVSRVIAALVIGIIAVIGFAISGSARSSEPPDAQITVPRPDASPSVEPQIGEWR